MFLFCSTVKQKENKNIINKYFNELERRVEYLLEADSMKKNESD